MKLALLSDIHEDVESLQKVLRKIEKESFDQILCLGDIAGFDPVYYPRQRNTSASACLKLLRESECTILLGNHDLHSIQRFPKHSAFTYPDNWYELSIEERKKLSNDQLWLYETENNSDFTVEDIEYLSGCNEEVLLELPEISLLFTHYVHPNSSGSHKELFQYPEQFRDHFNYMSEAGARISFCGHAHIPGSMLVQRNNVKFVRRKCVIDYDSIVFVPPVATANMKARFMVFNTLNREIRIMKA